MSLSAKQLATLPAKISSVLNLSDENQKEIESLIQSMALKPLPVTALETLDEVLECFSLSSDESCIWELEKKEILPIPQFLAECIRRFKIICKSTNMNVAACRFRIDFVLLASLSDLLENLDTPSQVSLHFETPLSDTIKYRGEQRKLSGKSDYSLAYGNGRNPETNMVAIEAKRVGGESYGEPQLAAYMGIIHQQRKRAGKRNCVVYGILTTHASWIFYRIDNNGKFSNSDMMKSQYNMPIIYSYLNVIVRAALDSSPSTSPEKNAEVRELRFQSFADAELSKRFDFKQVEAENLPVEDLSLNNT